MQENNLTFVIDEEHAGERADSVLSLLLEKCSRSYAVKLIEQGNVFLDGRLLSSKKEKLRKGSVVSVLLPPAKALEALPENIPVNIVYEDDELLVVDKPKGMVVHPAPGNDSGTLVNALLYHCKNLSSINGVERPGIVHRIDKDTSGLLVCAKTDLAHRGLSKQLAVHSMTRVYEGICFFSFKEDKFTVDAPIGRDPKNRLRMAVLPSGREAVTHIRLLEQLNGFSRFEARLETGRTHQIRVHMAYRHHPLLGDRVYGASRQPYGIDGQMLHAKALGFIHPGTGKYMEFNSALPEEFLSLLNKLR